MNELDIYARQGLGHQSGFGVKPALLIVDFVNGFNDPALFRTIVVTDAVGDRATGPHEANLFDMGQKYADLHSCLEVVAYLDGIFRS